jgi:hypothetical protein
LKVAKGIESCGLVLNTYEFCLVIYDHSSLAAEGYRYCGAVLGPPGGGPAGLKCMEAVVVVAKQQNGE